MIVIHGSEVWFEETSKDNVNLSAIKPKTANIYRVSS